MIFDIRKPMSFQTGLYRLNKNADYNFQLNRLINMDGADRKDDIVLPGIADEQRVAMPNARSVTTRILTEREQVSDHCNCGNQKLAMDVVLEWLSRISNNNH